MQHVKMNPPVPANNGAGNDRERMLSEEPIPLGSIASDIVTGFKGVIVARTEWMTGCTRYGIQSRKLKEDGSVLDIQWFDEAQVMVTVSEPAVEIPQAPPAGPTPAPQRNPDPKR